MSGSFEKKIINSNTFFFVESFLKTKSFLNPYFTLFSEAPFLRLSTSDYLKDVFTPLKEIFGLTMDIVRSPVVEPGNLPL